MFVMHLKMNLFVSTMYAERIVMGGQTVSLIHRARDR